MSSAVGGCSLSALDISEGFDVCEVLSEEYTRSVEFLELKAVEIDRRHTHRALQVLEPLSRSLLPGNLQYVRLCKALDADRLLLLYGSCAEPPFRSEFECAGIAIHSVRDVRVPRHSPCTVDQFRDWSRYWPLRYLKPSFTPLALTPPLRARMLGHIASAVTESHRHGGSSVCLITFKDRVIARAVDRRRENILMHSALLAVRQVADLQKDDPLLMSNAKRRAAGEPAVAAPPGSCDASSSPELPDYLCTHCEAFVSHEPCCMCAMALLHSRVSSVTFFYPNASIGALGSVHSLHNKAGLNHHFRAFRVDRK